VSVDGLCVKGNPFRRREKAILSIAANFTNNTRSGVAVFLSAILALKNSADEAVPVKGTHPHCQRFGWFRWLWQWLGALSQKWQKSVAPVVVNKELPAPAAIPPAPGPLQAAPAPITQPATTEETTVEQVEIPTDVADAPTEPLVAVEQAVAEQVRLSEQLVEVSELDFTGLSGIERIAKVLELFPDLSDRGQGRLSNMSAATVKKHRETLRVSVATEGSQ
jgi:hypothetical protein